MFNVSNSFTQVFPVVKALPAWVGPGGLDLCGGLVSINVVAPLLLVGITIILCQGVKESSVVNDVMTVTKVRIFFRLSYVCISFRSTVFIESFIDSVLSS
jgi:amino acid transporter